MGRQGWRRAGRGRAIVGGGVLAVLLAVAPALGDQDEGERHPWPRVVAGEGPSLGMPVMNSARGRVLFAGKGCVICHAVNGVGGDMGPSLDASKQMPFANPFDFAARMWGGAAAMIALQEKELGYQIELDGDELADIVAFAHDRGEQEKFSEFDIPDHVLSILRAIVRTQPL